MNRSGAVFVWLVAIVALLALGVAGFFHYSSSPSFCKNCHIMEPYHKSWSQSKHNNVECVKCHFEPGLAGTLKGKIQAARLVVNYAVGKYSPKPFANIKDASCLQPGCHIKEKLGAVKSFKGKSSFDHRPHFREGLQTDLTCTSCHSPLRGGGEHISVNEAHCYMCHLNKAEAAVETRSDTECVKCHKNLPRSLVKNGRTIVHEDLNKRRISCFKCHGGVVRGSGAVGETTCFKCHDFAERDTVKMDKQKLHKIHVVAHVECFLCHSDITHRQEGAHASGGCGSCHLDRHSAVKLMYDGKGGRGVPDKPAPMSLSGLDCAGCHDSRDFSTPRDPVKTAASVRKRCLECHENEMYGRLLDQWKTALKLRLASVSKKLEDARKRIEKMGAKAAKARPIFENARYNYYFVRDGVGVHNVGYAGDLLDYVDENLSEIIAALSQNRDPVEKRPDAGPDGKSEDSGDIFVFRDTPGLPPVHFDHQAHQGRSEGCETCHESVFSMRRGAADERGELSMNAMRQGRFCGHCHDGKTAPSVRGKCSFCHIEDKTVKRAVL